MPLRSPPATRARSYNPEEFVSSQSQCKSSVARAIRARILQDYPEMEEVLEHILPKKQQLTVAKGQNHVQLLLDASGEVMFFQHRDSGWYPSLRLAHRYPELMPTWQVDEVRANRLQCQHANMCAQL